MLELSFNYIHSITQTYDARAKVTLHDWLKCSKSEVLFNT